MDEQPIVQADRDAAADYTSNGGKIETVYHKGIRSGHYDHPLAHAFAAHRIASNTEARRAVIEECAEAARNALVAYEWPPQDGDRQIDAVLDAIRALAKATQ